MKHFVTPLLLFFLLSSNVLIAHPGTGIVMDSEGTIFYTDLVHVWKITAEGTHVIAVKDVHTHELYLDDDDNLYGEHVWYNGEAADTWGYYVWCLSNTGVLEQTIPPSDGFPINNTLVRDFEGSMFYAEKLDDYEILKKETIQGQISQHSGHHFKDIRWMYYSEYDRNLYVIDYLHLKRVSPNGEVIVISDQLKESGRSHGSVEDHHYLMGVWSDEMRRMYVAVYGARKVKKIDPDGAVETIYKTPRFWSPTGGLAAPDGSLWIMEFSVRNRTRVRKISSDGTKVIYQS